MSMVDGVWRKSTYSNQTGGECIECRTTQDHVLVRDSQHPAHGHLAFPGTEWAAFLHAVREGALDR
jgi:hypothetical protein